MRLRAVGQGLARRRPDLAVRVDRVDGHLAGGIGGGEQPLAGAVDRRYRPCSRRAARCADGSACRSAGSIAKLAIVNGSLRSAAYRNRRSGLSASGMLVGDGSSAPGIGDFFDQLDIALGAVERQHRDARIAGNSRHTRRVSGFSCAIAATAFSALQIAGGARGGPFGAALHPVRRLRHVRESIRAGRAQDRMLATFKSATVKCSPSR